MKAALLALAASLCVAGNAAAQDAVAEFYRGKTVRITVGSAVGGGFDGYARLVGRHFGKHIPGNPTVVVQNIPGSGSNKAASYVALQAPKDGTAIGAIQPGAVLQTAAFRPAAAARPVEIHPARQRRERRLSLPGALGRAGEDVRGGLHAPRC